MKNDGDKTRIDKMRLVIRKAAAGDAAHMKAMARQVGEKNCVPFLGQGNVDEYLNSGALEKDIDAHMSCTVVCEYEGQIVGMCAFLDDYIHVLLVKHAVQGCGVGKVLLCYAEDKLFKSNSRIWLKTFEKNSAAIAFYEKNGWERAGAAYSEYIDGYYVRLEKVKTEAQC